VFNSIHGRRKKVALSAIIFLILNLIEPIFGVPTFISYLGWFASYTPTANTTILTNQLTGLAISLPYVILVDVLDGILSGILGVLFSYILNLSDAGIGGRTVHFSDGRIVKFRNK